jgi:hypothetical protein
MMIMMSNAPLCNRETNVVECRHEQENTQCVWSD